MNAVDYTIKCSQCGRKMGVVSLVYIGVPHNTGLDEGCCMDCLPKQIEKLEAEGYNADSLKRIKDWMEQSDES